MKTKYKEIFKPLTIKNMTLKNRIMMPPMGTNFGKENGEISAEHITYYEQRAKGGTGLIMLENISINSPEGSNGTTQLRMDKDSYLPMLFKLTETMHKYDTCIGVQLNHAGASAMSKRINMQPVSSSNIPSKEGGEIPRPLKKDEIYRIVKQFGEAAKRAQIAGFDCVEIHAGHSYLISQFLSPLYNKRTDEFGGSAENRARFAKLVIEEVRKQVGPQYPIFVRVSADEFMNGGNTLEDTLELISYFEEYVDAFDVSAGLNGSIQFQIDANYLKDGWRSYLARAVKEKYNKPCVATGNFRDPKVVNETLLKGDCDIVGIGRGLIADPEWVNKVEFGHEDLLRKCISCNIGCAGNRIGINRPIRCTINPSVVEGEVYKSRKIDKDCNVVVIGGGTSGLEAACTASELGCTTFVLEKNDHLGGLSTEISKMPSKKRLGDFPEYLINRANSLKNLYVLYNTEGKINIIKNLKPDIIVNATGSTPLLPPINGLAENVDKPNSSVYSITGLIDKLDNFPDNVVEKKIVVVGGGAVGLDVVEHFAPKGANVSVIEMMSQIGADLDPVSKNDIYTIMKENKVKQMINTRLIEVKNDRFIVLLDNEITEIPFDYGFVCLGMKSEPSNLNDIRNFYDDVNDVEIINIGDSKRARRIIDGTGEGRNIISTLEKRGFLKI